MKGLLPILNNSDINRHSLAAILAMKRMSEIAAKNGISDMTLEEINAEINAVRKNKIKGNTIYSQ